ncbi:MAG: transaldolase family protein [Microthrixaceae bacterium]
MRRGCPAPARRRRDHTHQAAPRPGTEPLARQHHPDDARRRHDPAVRAGVLRHRTDLQPSIFDKAIAGGGYDEAIAQKSAAGHLRRGPLHGDRHRGPPPGGGPVRRGPLLHGRPRRLRLPRGVPPSWPTTPLPPSRPRRSCTPGRTVRTCSSRSPAPARGCPPSPRRSRPSAGERHAAVRHRPVPRRCRCLHVGHRGPGWPRARIRAVASVASVFMSRWDAAVAGEVPGELTNRLALAVGGVTYRAYRELQASDRWLALQARGARMQRLLWASTSTKDPAAPDTMYVAGLAAPDTINTMPDSTLEAFHDHGVLRDPMDSDGGDAESVLEAFEDAGVSVAELAEKLQVDGAGAFVKSWTDLMDRIESQTEALR